MKLDAKQLRTTKSTPGKFSKVKKNPIYIVLDNVLDTYNIGAIFRLADAVAAEKVILCGQSETPPHTRIKKASINTTEWVAWSYAPTAVGAINDLRDQFSTPLEQYVQQAQYKYSSSESRSIGANREVPGIQIVAIEQSSKSVPYDRFDYSFPIALVVGHETNGVSKEVLEICDGVVELPMFGVNVSLNVMVSLGIVLYRVAGNLVK